MRKRGLALVVVTGAAVLGTAGAGPACFDHTCEAGTATNYGDHPATPREHLVADDTWESTPIDAPWLEYPPYSGYTLIVPTWVTENRPLVEMHAYLSGSPSPGASGNYAEASGNSVEFSQQKPGQVFIYNATCAHFWLRVVLRGGRPLVDAGAAE